MKTLISAVVLSVAFMGAAHAELSSNQPEGPVYAAMPLDRLQAAAEQGNVNAMFFLANRYKNGEGVAQNLSQSFSWYLKAAQKGAAAAQLNVGQMYALGRGVQQDLAQAKLWLQKAARQGDNRASYNLALLEERDQNLASAYTWYEVSTRDGMLDDGVRSRAQGKIRKLAANLSPEDQQRARLQADQWLQQ